MFKVLCWGLCLALTLTLPLEARTVTVYSLPQCHDCRELIDTKLADIQRSEQAQGRQFDIEELDILDSKHFEKLQTTLNQHGLNFTGVPVLVSQDLILQGNELDEKTLENHFTSKTSFAKPEVQIVKTTPALQLNILGIVAAGFLDGINPCALSTLFFLLSVLALDSRNNKLALQVGLGFCFGVFVSYVALAMGLLSLAKIGSAIPWGSTAIKALSALAAFIFAILSIRDALHFHKKEYAKATLKLPLKLQKFIHHHIRTQKVQYLALGGAIVLGASISLLEFVCTGQVYLPTLVYLAHQNPASTLPLVLVYNLAFISPLATIFILSYQGLSNQILVKWYQNNLSKVRLALAVLFTVMGLGFLSGVL